MGYIMDQQPTPSLDDDEMFDLVSQVSGLGDTVEPNDGDFEEADRLIADPDIPCSDLRGLRDHQYTGNLADAWYNTAFPNESKERD